MTFWGKYLVISNIFLEEVSDFNYICRIAKKTVQNVTRKLAKIQIMFGIIHRKLKNKIKKETMLTFYKTWQQGYTVLRGGKKHTSLNGV